MFIVAFSRVAGATVAAFKGIYCVSGRDAAVSNFSTCLSNPATDGLAYYAAWSTLETSDGVYAWTEIDNAIAALGTNQHIAIEVDAGAYSPAWLFASDPTMDFAFIWKGVNGGGRTFGNPTNMPIPWNTTFLTKWKAFVDTASARYAANAKVVAVNMFPIDRGNVTDNLPHNPWPSNLPCPNSAPASFCTSYVSLSVNGNMTAGSNVVTSAAAPFTSSMGGTTTVTIVGAGGSGFYSYLNGYVKYISTTQIGVYQDAALTVVANATHSVTNATVNLGTYLSYADSDNWVTAGYTRLKIQDPVGLNGAWDQMASKLNSDFPNQHWIDPVDNYNSNFCAFPPIDNSGVEQANDSVTYIDYQDCLVNATIDIQGGGYYAHNSCTGCSGSALYAANWTSAAGNLGPTGGSLAVVNDGTYVSNVFQETKALGCTTDFTNMVNWVIAHASANGTVVEMYKGDVSSCNQSSLNALHLALGAVAAGSGNQSVITSHYAN